MDGSLKCNYFKCRSPFNQDGKAVVTACSHIFCMTCANRLFSQAQICPACDRPLPEPDDIVVSCLDPSADYKASILAGLTPSLILEIAAKGLGFWTYQQSQEGEHQSILLRNAQNRVSRIEAKLESVLRELHLTRERNTALQHEVQLAEQKNLDLSSRLREKESEIAQIRGRHERSPHKGRSPWPARSLDHIDPALKPSIVSTRAPFVVRELQPRPASSSIIHGRSRVTELKGDIRPSTAHLPPRHPLQRQSASSLVNVDQGMAEYGRQTVARRNG